MQVDQMRVLFGITERPRRSRRRQRGRGDAIEQLLDQVEGRALELEAITRGAMTRGGVQTLASRIYYQRGLVGRLPIFGYDASDEGGDVSRPPTDGEGGDVSRPPTDGDGGTSTPTPAMADRIRNAAKVLAAVRPGLNNAATQIFLGDVKAESGFGYGFKTPDGSNSNNWGAIYAPGDRGTIPVNDTNDGKAFVGGAAWWSTPEGGARQFVNLIEGSYAPALERASAGDSWGYARALWRDGPGSSRPPYYGGFPPGDKRGTTPAGVPLHSDLDHWYRITAYARMVQGSAAIVAAALGQPLAAHLTIPPQPGGGTTPADPVKVTKVASGSSIGAGAVIAGVALLGVAAFVVPRLL